MTADITIEVEAEDEKEVHAIINSSVVSIDLDNADEVMVVESSFDQIEITDLGLVE